MEGSSYFMSVGRDRQVEAGIRLRSLCEKIVGENRRGGCVFSK